MQRKLVGIRPRPPPCRPARRRPGPPVGRSVYEIAASCIPPAVGVLRVSAARAHAWAGAVEKGRRHEKSMARAADLRQSGEFLSREMVRPDSLGRPWLSQRTIRWIAVNPTNRILLKRRVVGDFNLVKSRGRGGGG